jgi:hypothetical protein
VFAVQQIRAEHSQQLQQPTERLPGHAARSCTSRSGRHDAGGAGQARPRPPARQPDQETRGRHAGTVRTTKVGERKPEATAGSRPTHANFGISDDF